MGDVVQWLRHMSRSWGGASNYYSEAADKIEELHGALKGLMPLLAKYEGQGEGGKAEFDGPVGEARAALSVIAPMEGDRGT